MSRAKKRLVEIESKGKYLFHGSPNEVDIFEPRQAYDWSEGERKEDGEPAVFASPSSDYSIFMAIFNMKNCPKGFNSTANTSSKSLNNEDFEMSFSVTKDTLEQINEDSSGWVYVFKKEDFPNRKNPSEFFTNRHVTPIEKIKVKAEDLPDNIEIK